jgi:DNA-directed RNA polymerase specialized sigma24 family protein
MAYRVIRGILGKPADAAEVLQNVFWRPGSGLPVTTPSEEGPEAWIVMRARARAIGRVRSVRKRTEVFGAPLGAAAAAAPAEPGATSPPGRRSESA